MLIFVQIWPERYPSIPLGMLKSAIRKIARLRPRMEQVRRFRNSEEGPCSLR